MVPVSTVRMGLSRIHTLKKISMKKNREQADVHLVASLFVATACSAPNADGPTVLYWAFDFVDQGVPLLSDYMNIDNTPA